MCKDIYIYLLLYDLPLGLKYALSLTSVCIDSFFTLASSLLSEIFAFMYTYNTV